MFQIILMAIVMPQIHLAAEDPMTIAMHKEAMKHRKQYDLKPQVLDEKCCQIAQKWAEHMASQHSMYHGGGEQIIAVGYSTPESAFRAWMASSGHRYWVLSSRDKCGWGAAQSSTGRWYWAGAFRNSAKPATKSATKFTAYTPVRRSRFQLFRRRR